MTVSRERQIIKIFYTLAKENWSSHIILIRLAEELMDSPDLGIRDMAFLTLVEIQRKVKEGS